MTPDEKKFEAGTPCPDCGGIVIHTGDLIECLECGKRERDGSVSIDQLKNSEPEEQWPE